jgi:2,5-diketo-D-gluconate reductase A
MIEMRNEGLMRSIGVSNFNADHLARLIKETGEAPVLNQIEINPLLQQPELRAVCSEHKIVAQAWTPLGNGKSFEADPIKAAAARTGKSPGPGYPALASAARPRGDRAFGQSRPPGRKPRCV